MLAKLKCYNLLQWKLGYCITPQTRAASSESWTCCRRTSSTYVVRKPIKFLKGLYQFRMVSQPCLWEKIRKSISASISLFSRLRAGMSGIDCIKVMQFLHVRPLFTRYGLAALARLPELMLVSAREHGQGAQPG